MHINNNSMNKPGLTNQYNNFLTGSGYNILTNLCNFNYNVNSLEIANSYNKKNKLEKWFVSEPDENGDQKETEKSVVVSDDITEF